MSAARIIALPLLLVVIGIFLLIGCIPVPATHQLQPDGRPRPEFAVGTGADKPVRLGLTTIDDAFIELSKRTGKTVSGGGLFAGSVRSGVNPPWSILNWTVSPDRRQFTLAYQIRTSTMVAPLCFMAEPQTAGRWMTLDVDEDGVVRRVTTSDQRPSYARNIAPDEWLNIFTEPQRRKLQSAGMLPTDEILRQAGEFARQRPMIRPPTTQDREPRIHR